MGLDIAHARYHHHGGYLLANADLPGFVRLEQRLLAALVANPSAQARRSVLGRLPGELAPPLFKLIVLLRLAVLLNRTRSPMELPQIELRPGSDLLDRAVSRGWLGQNPLTAADLEQERGWLQARGFELRSQRRSDGLRDLGELAQQR